jgi:hypothetical protein
MQARYCGFIGSDSGVDVDDGDAGEVDSGVDVRVGGGVGVDAGVKVGGRLGDIFVASRVAVAWVLMLALTLIWPLVSTLALTLALCRFRAFDFGVLLIVDNAIPREGRRERTGKL